MDTRYHRTLTLPYPAPIVQQPVDVAPGVYATVEFRATGDRLCGDPIYYQVRGPALPVSWWHRGV